MYCVPGIPPRLTRGINSYVLCPPNSPTLNHPVSPVKPSMGIYDLTPFFPRVGQELCIVSPEFPSYVSAHWRTSVELRPDT